MWQETWARSPAQFTANLEHIFNLTGFRESQYIGTGWNLVFWHEMPWFTIPWILRFHLLISSLGEFVIFLDIKSFLDVIFFQILSINHDYVKLGSRRNLHGYYMIKTSSFRWWSWNYFHRNYHFYSHFLFYPYSSLHY